MNEDDLRKKTAERAYVVRVSLDDLLQLIFERKLAWEQLTDAQRMLNEKLEEERVRRGTNELTPRQSEQLLRVSAKYQSEDLDTHVSELKNEEAAAINNGGMMSQYRYLLQKGGEKWIEQLLLGDSV